MRNNPNTRHDRLIKMYESFIDILIDKDEQTISFIDWRDCLEERNVITVKESVYLSNLYYQD